MTKVTHEFDLYGKHYTLEAGELAKQATGACIVKCGDSTVLLTAVVSKERKDYDFFPLTVDFIEKIAPLIVKEPSITAQNTYIHLLTDHLPSFDYQQVEHIINESRVRKRQEKVQQVSNPTPITMSVSKQLTAVMRAEAHILYRMMEHPLVLNDYRLRDDFVFVC